MLFDRNAVWWGFLLGVLTPVVGYALLLVLIEQIEAAGWFPRGGGSPFHTRTVILIAVCLNVLPFQWYQRCKYTQTMRGIVFATLVASGVWLYFFARELTIF